MPALFSLKESDQYSPWTNGFHPTVSRLWGPMIYIYSWTFYVLRKKRSNKGGDWVVGDVTKEVKSYFRFAVKLAARHRKSKSNKIPTLHDRASSDSSITVWVSRHSFRCPAGEAKPKIPKKNHVYRQILPAAIRRPAINRQDL